MELLFFAGVAIVTGIIFVGMGLSFLNQSLDFEKYNTDSKYSYGLGFNSNSKDYYNNPLYRLKSKWFYYRPVGAVVLTKDKWKKIEDGINVKIAEAMDEGKVKGRKALMDEIKAKVEEEREKAVPSSPYALLGVKATDPISEIKVRYKQLSAFYDPKKFKHLDSDFRSLALIRTNQLNEAWRKIRNGVGQNG